MTLREARLAGVFPRLKPDGGVTASGRIADNFDELKASRDELMAELIAERDAKVDWHRLDAAEEAVHILERLHAEGFKVEELLATMRAASQAIAEGAEPHERQHEIVEAIRQAIADPPLKGQALRQAMTRVFRNNTALE